MMGSERGSNPGVKTTETEKLKQFNANLIISVIGNIQKGEEQNDARQLVLRSLAEIADSRGTWIISFGTKEEAIQFLELKQSSYNVNEKSIEYHKTTFGEGILALDQDVNNNIHAAKQKYLLLTDKTDLECYKDSCSMSKDEKSVVIVVGDDLPVLEKAHYAATHGIPVVVVKGSGSVADFIAAGHNQYPLTDPLVENVLSTDEAMVITKDKTKLDRCVQLRTEILEEKEYVNIYKNDDGTEIQDVILLALKKAHPVYPKLLLSLAWRWNKIDFARKGILFQKTTAENETTSVTKAALCSTLFATLANDQADFVELLLRKELKVDVTTLINVCTLQKLYSNVLDHNTMNDSMKLFMKNQLSSMHGPVLAHTNKDSHDGKERTKSDVVGNTRWGKKDECQPNRKCELDLILRVGRLLCLKLNDDNMRNPYLPKDADDGTERKIGFVDLFLFAVLFNRRKLGECMWRHCQNKLGAALVASSILKTFAKSAGRNLELQLSTDLMNHSSFYEKKASDVLTECFKRDKKMAQDLLIKKLEPPFDLMSPLALVDNNYLKYFMGNECCQTKLNGIWRGKIATHLPWWKILLALFMPIFIFGIKFTTNNRPFKVQTFCGRKPNRNKGNPVDNPDEHAQTSGGTKRKINKVNPGDKPDVLAQTCCGTDKAKTNKVEQQNKLHYYLNIGKESSKPQLYSVGMRCNQKDGVIQIVDAMYYLYTSPFSVYTLNMLSYVIFMFYFSYFIIVDLDEETSFREYTIWAWAVTMFVEEMRQLITHRTPGLNSKIKVWIGSHWNKFDLLINILFITTVALRYELSGNAFQYVRFLYSITVAMYFMRFLQAFLVAKNIGPKIIMIRKMLVSLLSFLGIFMVFFVSFSVMYQANLYPNSPPSVSLLKKLVYKPYWQIFGELFLDELSGDEYGDCTTNATVWRSAGGQGRCPENTRLVIFIGAIYVILTQIVLVNLLIAMFSNTFESVHEQSSQIWKFYWYGIVREYYERPVFCPPLIILVHIYRTIRHGVKRLQKRVSDNEFRLSDENLYGKQLLKFAEAATDRYLQQTIQERGENNKPEREATIYKKVK
ncbi:transient receptor potential cation channel subfamily M member-like 2 isoform X2 [Dreissena polymorpha]|uniref:transient receptor potential cation channel subfamily M member-like 2 isoform X2 n=1 Tax=Dreissena polymorpha TaxID=45954 RepID=UPI002265128E|nr:transient receptor potential cation channel subfamily M member-like 2 isoform X2 [Dreissena polymorpha]